MQRVPATEKRGRVHSSTCIVVILPEEKFQYEMDMKDVRIDTYRASGHGGQHVNKTESAVRAKHLPSGITVCIQNERDQHQNKKIAIEKLIEKVRNTRYDKFKEKQNSTIKDIMGTGDLSEKIRTYNWPDNRITDHRAKCTLIGIDKMLNGELLDSFLDQLMELERVESLEKLIY